MVCEIKHIWMERNTYLFSLFSFATDVKLSFTRLFIQMLLLNIKLTRFKIIDTIFNQPMGVLASVSSLPGLRTLDPLLGSSWAWAEIFRRFVCTVIFTCKTCPYVEEWRILTWKFTILQVCWWVWADVLYVQT